MFVLQFIVLSLCLFSMGCHQFPSKGHGQRVVVGNDGSTGSGFGTLGKELAPDVAQVNSQGALLLTDFKSLEQFKEVVKIEYFSPSDTCHGLYGQPCVRLTHAANGHEVTSILKPGVSELDFMKARIGGFGDRLRLLLLSPYAVIHRNDLVKVYYLSRRMDPYFGAGDPAFYDLAETSVYNITPDDMAFIDAADLSEKGYINTFNHITAQVFMTTLFSEKLADFVADSHERAKMPELISGKFTEDQLADLETGPIDNYVDIINNEWGQELGKILSKKYNIHPGTHWTPALLADFLNDIQQYYSWAFQISFMPYRPEDEVVTRFASKINIVVGEQQKLK